jgi:hypothetical protein
MHGLLLVRIVSKVSAPDSDFPSAALTRAAMSTRSSPSDHATVTTERREEYEAF